MPSYDLQLPEGFCFEGDMQFFPANVVVDQAELAREFKNLCLTFIDNWEDGDYVHLGKGVPIKINGHLFAGTIVNMNQYGQLILRLNYWDCPSAAPVLGLEESAGQYFYVRSRKPDSINDPVVVEQGVMVHDSHTDIDGPIHGDHADAIVAFSYLVTKP